MKSRKTKSDVVDANARNVDVKQEDDDNPPVPEISLPEQARTLKMFACNTIPIRSFHITWITFLWCFFAWFCTTNIFREVSNDFTLTLPEQQLALSLSVTSTIIFRIIIAELCPKYGSRVSYIVVLVCTMITLIALSLVQTSVGYIICHIFLGIAGASFVITQYHTTRLFAGKIVGSAQAITAGFGNFGGGVVNFVAPFIVYYIGISWRWFLICVVIILFFLCFIYYFCTQDDARVDPQASIPLIEPIQTRSTVDKIQVGGYFEDAFYDYRSWVLFACYACSFGVEITFYLVAAQYFQVEFGLNEIEAGLIVMIWSSINLFARPFGGYLCDKYTIVRRAKILFIILFLESFFIILFGALGHLSFVASIVLSMLFSVCIQMAEGATFSIVAFIQPKSVGHVIGIVASGGNFGAAFFIFVIFLPWNYSDYDEQYSWLVLGIVVMICSFCALMIQFTNRELHDSNQNMIACYDLQSIKTTQKIDTKEIKFNVIE